MKIKIINQKSIDRCYLKFSDHLKCFIFNKTFYFMLYYDSNPESYELGIYNFYIKDWIFCQLTLTKVIQSILGEKQKILNKYQIGEQVTIDINEESINLLYTFI